MSRAEIAFRARAAARTQIDRMATTARRPRWERADLSRVVAPYVLDAPLAEAIGRADWADVHRRLVGVLRSRPSRFVIDSAMRAEICGAILSRWPGAARDASVRADRIANGEYDLLGYRGLRFSRGENTIDWHLDAVTGRRAPRAFWADVPYLDPAIGDHKVIWELNRHQHWVALGRAFWLTGDLRYRREIVAQLRSWLADNPPLIGVNWASMLEIGFRSLSWLSVLHLLLGDAGEPSADNRDADEDEWTVDLLVALHHQLEHVARNLSCYFSPNTHLLGEALALYVVGQSLPEMARSPRWTDLGRRILLEQIDCQIEPDGGHAERSFHYHRYAHDFYLLALLTAERCGDEDAAETFREAIGRMATFLREVTGDDDGRMPLVGDDDGGMLWPMAGRDSADVRDSLALAAAVLDRPELAPWGTCEETLWLAWTVYGSRLHDGIQGPESPAGAKVAVFPSSGYVVARDGDGGQVVFDAGPHGFLNAGHAHADALSITVTLDHRALLIDPGTGSYTADARLRDRLRRTANHNTLTVGGRSSSIPAGPFHWESRADARLERAVANAAFAWLEGTHDGYRGFRHRRSVVQADAGWLVVDELIGHRVGDAHVHWHFDPRWSVARQSAHALAAKHVDGACAWLVHDGCAASLAYGDPDSGLGWCSPRYGAVVPTWSARLARTPGGPPSLVTWIGASGRDEGPPSLERVPSETHDDGPAIAVCVRRPFVTSLTAIRPGLAQPLGVRQCTAGGYHTNARLLHYTLDADGTQTSLALAEGSRALALDDAFVSLSADVAVRDVSLRIDGGYLDLRASAPPPLMRLRGRALGRVVTVRLNGRGMPRPRPSPDGDIVLTGGDWPEGAMEPGVDLCVA